MVAAQSTVCSTSSSSSALAPGASVCCYNSSVTFKQLEIYASSVDMNGMSGCLTISWSCGTCVSNTGRVCESQYSYQCYALSNKFTAQSAPTTLTCCSLRKYRSKLMRTSSYTSSVFLCLRLNELCASHNLHLAIPST